MEGIDELIEVLELNPYHKGSGPGGGQFTGRGAGGGGGGGGVRGAFIDTTGRVDTAGIGDMVQKAIEEQPSRATHGNTAGNAFYISGNKVVGRNEIASLSAPERAKAIMVHSHSVDNWQAAVQRTGKPESFEPLNSTDIHTWLGDVKHGLSGNATGIIMADGRMELLAMSSKTNPKIFNMGEKTLRGVLEPTRSERQAYYAAHRGAGWDDYMQARDLLRGFSKRYGLQYLEGLRWK